MSLIANAEVSSASMGADTHCKRCCCERILLYTYTQRGTEARVRTYRRTINKSCLSEALLCSVRKVNNFVSSSFACRRDFRTWLMVWWGRNVSALITNLFSFFH